MWVNIYEHAYGVEAVAYKRQDDAFDGLDQLDASYTYRETIAKTPQGWVSVDLKSDLDEWRHERDAELAAERRHKHNQSLRYPGV